MPDVPFVPDTNEEPTSDCCDAEVLPPFGAPFDAGEAVCADCGATVEVDDE